MVGGNWLDFLLPWNYQFAPETLGLVPLIAGNLQTLVKIMGCSRYNTCIHLKVTGEDWLSGAYCPGTIQDVGLPSYTKEGGVPKTMVSDNFVKYRNTFCSLWILLSTLFLVIVRCCWWRVWLHSLTILAVWPRALGADVMSWWHQVGTTTGQAAEWFQIFGDRPRTTRRGAGVWQRGPW